MTTIAYVYMTPSKVLQRFKVGITTLEPPTPALFEGDQDLDRTWVLRVKTFEQAQNLFDTLILFFATHRAQTLEGDSPLRAWYYLSCWDRMHEFIMSDMVSFGYGVESFYTLNKGEKVPPPPTGLLDSALRARVWEFIPSGCTEGDTLRALITVGLDAVTLDLSLLERAVAKVSSLPPEEGPGEVWDEILAQGSPW